MSHMQEARRIEERDVELERGTRSRVSKQTHLELGVETIAYPAETIAFRAETIAFRAETIAFRAAHLRDTPQLVAFVLNHSICKVV